MTPGTAAQNPPAGGAAASEAAAGTAGPKNAHPGCDPGALLLLEGVDALEPGLHPESSCQDVWEVQLLPPACAARRGGVSRAHRHLRGEHGGQRRRHRKADVGKETKLLRGSAPEGSPAALARAPRAAPCLALLTPHTSQDHTGSSLRQTPSVPPHH